MRRDSVLDVFDPAFPETDARSRARRWDRGALALLVLFVLAAPLVTQRIYASDEIQYFAYTHSLFFDGDLDFNNEYLYFCNVDKVKFADFCRDLYGKREPDTGLPINVAPIGTGLFWLPSYALAHAGVSVARGFGAKVAADGYSQPYIAAICLTSYLFGCLGLLLAYRFLRKRFEMGVAFASILLVWLGTSVVFYMVIAPPWSHATSLLAVTLFLWYWDRTRLDEGRRIWQWAVLGAQGGAVMLIREQDALFLVVPAIEALWALGVTWRRAAGYKLPLGSGEGGASRLKAFASTAGSLGRYSLRWLAGLLVMALVAAVVFVPQLVAYRVITGHFGPSKVVSSKLTWTSPNFLNVLFSPEHGLIPWAPLIAVALLGLIALWRWDRLLTVGLTLAFLLQVYVAGSFLTWQSASSFGQRRFINSTLIFALGLAAFGSLLLAQGWPRWLLVGVSALFLAWNAGLLMQYALWCSPQRQGLDWATVIKGQMEMPGKALQLIYDFVFNRQIFYRRTRGC